MARHHLVWGFDICPKTTERVIVARSLAETVRAKEFVFIAVPTPHHPAYDGAAPTSHLEPREFDYEPVKNVLSEMAPYISLRQKIVLISTVLPGTCRREFASLVPAGAHLLYNPYFIAMGTVQQDFESPEFIIIGTEDGSEDAADDLIRLYKTMIGDQVFHTVTWEEAEAVKMFYNTFISFKLGFVNMIQDVAVRLGHMDVDRVTGPLSSAGMRILSPMYMRAGMGDGGPCHPRDNIALRALSKRLDLGYDLFAGMIACREAQAQNLARFLCSFRLPVIILGKSYKPEVPLIAGSSSMLTGHYVGKHGDFRGFIDPLTGDSVEEDEPATYLLAHGGSRWYERNYPPDSVIVDPWRSCPPIAQCRVVHYGNTRGKCS